MTVEWVVLKYMPDVRRREPRNVAVAVLSEGEAEIRVLGQRMDGSIDGNKTRSTVRSSANLRDWMAYWRYLADLRAPLEDWVMSRPGDNYLVEMGGQVLLGEAGDPSELADELYATLVAPVGRRRQSKDEFGLEVDRLLERAGLLTRADYLGQQALEATSRETYTFPHVWQNGHVTVAARMPKFSPSAARNLLWQFEHLPSTATGRLVFTRTPLSAEENATAGLLDDVASVLPLESSPEDVQAAFERTA